MGPRWTSPHARHTGPFPEPAEKKPTIVEQALAVLGPTRPADPYALAAVIIAQALDRHAKSMIEAAAVSSYKRST
jgi:hypothetical protein